MVNHAMNNKTRKVIVTPYSAGMVNHVTKNETEKITVASYWADTINYDIKQQRIQLLHFGWYGEPCYDK